ncbi:MAG: 1,4-alpha-glucan branching protein GlgB [Erysipelotrichaceae bacterium]
MKMIIDEFHSGHCAELYKYYGAHRIEEGIHFAVYAPHAQKMSVVGSFNHWNNQANPMIRLPDGSWICTITHANVGDLYKYCIWDAYGNCFEKADPVGFLSEMRPQTASQIVTLDDFAWEDQAYIAKRSNGFDRPVNIYEVHLGGWMRKPNGQWHTYEEMISHLIPYVVENGYTHIEVMPLTEHPFDGSWGYQATGYFSATSRYGTPHQLKQLINAAHLAGIGVIFDLVLAHFVKDAHGLGHFDGTALYEYPSLNDARSEWDTLNFDLWKEEVRSFLISAGNFWIEEYHFDGLRIDAVSNIIYWGGNAQRGVNTGALDFMKRFNYILHQKHPGVMLIAEDSSAFQGVTKPVEYGGLGFDYKWDLGWMNDTLKYYGKDPIYRGYHHHNLTFSMAYFGSERFLMPLSHDEVVHGKGTIMNKMWGDYTQKFAQCRNLFMYMYAHPGKKLSFMGNELGQFREFDEEKEIDFSILSYPIHSAFHRFMKDLNQVYKHHSSLFQHDYEGEGFRWIDPNNSTDSIYSFYRASQNETILVILNMTPKSFEQYTIGVPVAGKYRELLNSDRDIYGGYNMCNYQPVSSCEYHIHGMQHAIQIRVAPFSAQYLILEQAKK